MRTPKISETQVLAILMETDVGAKVEDVSRPYGIPDATHSMWESEYGGTAVSELKCIKENEADTAQY